MGWTILKKHIPCELYIRIMTYVKQMYVEVNIPNDQELTIRTNELERYRSVWPIIQMGHTDRIA